MIIRKARIEDIPKLARILLESESTGHEMYTYSSLFELEKEEISERLKIVLNNEYEGHGLCYKNFIVAEEKDEILGGVSFYLEGINGGSNHLMTGALMTGFSRNEMINFFNRLKPYRTILLDKSVNTYQLDSGAVFEQFRGRGVFKNLWNFIENNINLDKIAVEGQIWKNNIISIKTQESNGFEVVKVIDLKNNGRVLVKKIYNGKK